MPVASAYNIEIYCTSISGMSSLHNIDMSWECTEKQDELVERQNLNDSVSDSLSDSLCDFLTDSLSESLSDSLCD